MIGMQMTATGWNNNSAVLKREKAIRGTNTVSPNYDSFSLAKRLDSPVLDAMTPSIQFAGRVDDLFQATKKRLKEIVFPEISTDKPALEKPKSTHSFSIFSRKGDLSMITLDTTNIDNASVGADLGIDVKHAFDRHRADIKTSVENLYGQKDTDGAWKRWLNLGYDDVMSDEIMTYADSVKGKYKDVVILGIGGSSLGGKALLQALLPSHYNTFETLREGKPRYHFIENVDADELGSLLKALDPKTTLFNIISKSGTTDEPMSAYMVARNWMEKSLSTDEIKERLVATTDRNVGVMRAMADREGLQTFEVPDDVGGRFSVFSAVGLLPAALMGVDIKALQSGIRDMDSVLQDTNVDKNPAAQLAVIQHVMTRKGKNQQVFMPYSSKLSYVADWFVQLWAESLGKKLDKQGNVVHTGQTPIKAVGATDQHSQMQLFNEGPQDKVITFLHVANPKQDIVIPEIELDEEAEKSIGYLQNQSMAKLMSNKLRGSRDAVSKNCPNLTLELPELNEKNFAQLLHLLMVTTAITGDLMGIDPFDQPGVEDGKKRTKAYMTDSQAEEKPKKPAPSV